MATNDFEMKGYLEEKATHALQEIGNIVDCLNREQSAIPPHIHQELKGELRAVLHDLTKVVAFLADSLKKASWDDTDLILEKGRKGVEEVLYFRYECAPEPEHIRIEREREEHERDRPRFVSSILQLSRSGVRDNRRAIYDECDKFAPDPLVERIRGLLEGVTQGTKKWEDFQQEVESLLVPFTEQTI